MDLADYRSGICDTEHLCSARDDYRNCEGCKWITYNWCQCKGTGHNSRYNYGFGRKVFCESIFWCGSAGILHWLCDGKDSGG